MLYAINNRRKLMTDQVIIFDTTLRDGEQSPGASMNTGEKLRLATQLEKLGVDVIEAGFPAASEGDFEAVSNIAGRLKKTAGGRSGPGHQGRYRPGLGGHQHAAKPRIHTFIATSDIHMEYKLKMTREEVIAAPWTRSNMPSPSPTMWNFQPKTAPAVTAIFCARCSRPPSRPAPPPSTCRIRWAMPSPRNSPTWYLRHAPHPQHRQGRLQRPLPQRSGAGHGQHPGGHQGRRPPGGSDHQRHRRTGRQHLPGRSGHGAAHPAQLSARDNRHQNRTHLSHQPAGQHDHRHHRAAQQGHRGGQRLCPRSRHPPGRGAEKPHDL